LNFSFFFFGTGNPFILDRTLELQVIDENDTVVLSKPVPSATIHTFADASQSATVIGQEIVLSHPVLFNSCTANHRLRFAWNISQSYTGPAQFVLDNVFVTPTLVRKIESETDTIKTINALISRNSLRAFLCYYIHARLPVEEAPKEIHSS
jgi:hypothetical protein